MNVNIVNAVWDIKHIVTKTCNLIAHAVIKIIGISLIKNYDDRVLCHYVLFSEENLHKEESFTDYWFHMNVTIRRILI